MLKIPDPDIRYSWFTAEMITPSVRDITKIVYATFLIDRVQHGTVLSSENPGCLCRSCTTPGVQGEKIDRFHLLRVSGLLTAGYSAGGETYRERILAQRL
jgi:hypothetical protein